MSKPLPEGRTGRSVVDYKTEEELRIALGAFSVSDENDNHTTSGGGLLGSKKADWILPVPDPDLEKQTIDGELQRLLTLRSYLMLDAESEEAFDNLTKEACELFQLPISLVTLVDFGRQFMFSKQGLPARETPRSEAFCAYTILSRKNICVVPDAKLDDRFRANKLVTGPPKLRFYAGASLISPEGYRLGTFCVEGTQPRPGGLTEKEQEKLKEYARRTVELMVERRKRLEERLSATPVNAKLRRHAAVATNLGAIMYRYDECVTAMLLLQQAVQTLMYVEEDQNGGPPAEEHQDRMAHLLTLMSYEANTPESTNLLMTQVAALVRDTGATLDTASVGGTATPPIGRNDIIDGIPGLFSPTSKLKGPAPDQHLPTLVFAEAFQVCLDDTGQPKPIDERQFTILIEQCAKATLFNMGLIHYHWGSPDSAMQFFDLAASLSHANAQTPLAFDPVVLGCLNNMAQINLQYRNSNNAMEMLTDALTRGNAALAAIYGEERPDSMQQDVARTRRLRRKLSRTVMNMGHVHFFKCDYDAAMIACNDALRLLHTNIEDTEAAAVWYNIGMLQYHKGDRTAALKYLDMFLERVRVLMGPKDLQMAEGLHRRGMILFEMGNLYESMKPLSEALSIRRSCLGPNHAIVAESLCLIGKVLLAREEYDFALNALQDGLSIQRKVAGEEGLSFEAAQTLLEVGRAYHAQNELKKSREVYEEVVGITRRLFGDRHPFVARLDIIIGNLFLESGNVDDSLVLFSEATHIHQEQGLPVNLGIVTNPLLGVQRDQGSVAPTA